MIFAEHTFVVFTVQAPPLRARSFQMHCDTSAGQGIVRCCAAVQNEKLFKWEGEGWRREFDHGQRKPAAEGGNGSV